MSVNAPDDSITVQGTPVVQCLALAPEPKSMTVNAITSARIRNATLGMVVAAIASFGYSVLIWAVIAGIPDRVQVLALDAYWVLITLWFVLPAGAVLGVYLPQSVAALNRKMAMRKGIRWGAASGIVCGALLALQLSLSLHTAEMLPWWIVLFGVTMGIYSACFVALAAIKCANE
jgi:hypothetical protein